MDNPLLEEIQWSQRYRPQSIEDCILPKTLKAELQGMIDGQVMPNLILSGPPGTGKTTAARAIFDQLGYDYIVLNGSGEDRGIDTIKHKVTRFATTMSLDGARKAILVDEADNLTHDAQLALRAVIENVSKNCTFVMTCNYIGRIRDALKSRSAIVDFNAPSAEKAILAATFYKRCCQILDTEKVEYDKKSVQVLVMEFYPDFRRALNAMQRAAATGKIDAASVTRVDEFASIISAVKSKNFTDMRKFLAETTLSPHDIFKRFSDDADGLYDDEKSWAQAFLEANEHDDRASRVADQQINVVSFLIKIMHKCNFK